MSCAFNTSHNCRNSSSVKVTHVVGSERVGVVGHGDFAFTSSQICFNSSVENGIDGWRDGIEEMTGGLV